jgi:hypothetical protein
MEETEVYPEEMSMEDIENFKGIIKDFSGSSGTYGEEYKEAIRYADTLNGRVYTMVDGENNETIYLKGYHYVNRLGYVVLISDLEVTDG